MDIFIRRINTNKPILYILLISSLFLVDSGMEFTLYEPSFVSDWYDAMSGNVNFSRLSISHGLGEYPVKVDVQVKIFEGGQEYIFSGIGSSQNDDDHPADYGGVIYIYNKETIELAYPFNWNGATWVTRGLAYTGHGSVYNGPSIVKGPYVNGYVRARAWLATDLPSPVINMSTTISMNDGNNFKELIHNLGSYPDIVTVQVLLPTGYMSDGMGVVFYGNTSYDWNRLGGVLFGFDDTKVRLWTPSIFGASTYGGYVFQCNDGYIMGQATSGTAHVLGWKHDKSQQVFYSEQTFNGSQHNILNLPFPINLTNYLVSVQFKIPAGEGPNGGMMFYAAGTTQATPLYKYGGIVYVYNEKQVFLWHPNRSPLVYIGDRWGSGQWAQETDYVNVIVQVYSLRKSECPLPELPGNTTYQVTGLNYGDTVTYLCNANYLHLGGDSMRTCGRDRRWSGTPPACVVCTNVSTTHSPVSDEEMATILGNIRVSKVNTGAYRRSHTSAEDKRFSAKVIGMSGVVVLVSVVGVLFLPDIVSLVSHMCDYSTISKKTK